MGRRASVLCAESLPSRIARQMSTLLVPAFSAASPRLVSPLRPIPRDHEGDEDGKWRLTKP